MSDYKMLAIRYLKQNKKRSKITILGTAITVMLLYGFLNIAWGYLLQTRKDLRANQDYELVLYTETQEQVENILKDSLVKSAYVGPYYSYLSGEGQMYTDALYVNTENPYRIDTTFKQLCAAYGINGRIRNELAWTYLQGSDGSLVVVIIYFTILAAFIFAIVGVGMVRNSIQLNMFENIRDYGNLRCIGSSKAELKMLIYLQGMMLELIGIAIGTLAGTILSSALDVYFASIELIHAEGGFHLLPLLLVLAVFLIDLYFAMGETAKLVMNMTPVEAIRGEYRIRKEKIKLREKSLLRRLAVKVFGVDGDYAVKSLLRSPGRFARTIGAMVFGIAMAMGIMTLVSSQYRLEKQGMREYGYYQMYVSNQLDLTETIEGAEITFPSEDILQEITEIPEFTEVKRSYSAVGLFPSVDDLQDHFTEEYRNTDAGGSVVYACSSLKQTLEEREEEHKTPYYSLNDIGIECYGYDCDDLARCQSVLLDGTTDISENGILLVNQVDISEEMDLDAADALYLDEERSYTVTRLNYQVGDTIDIVDIGEYHKRLREPLQKLNTTFYEEYLTEAEKDPLRVESIYSTAHRDFVKKAGWLMVDIWQELVEEGAYRTYTVEGIIKEDVNYKQSQFQRLGKLGKYVTVLMREDSFFDLTGLTAEQPTGINYHMEKIPARNMDLFELDDILGGNAYTYEVGFLSTSSDISWVTVVIHSWQEMRRYLLGAALIAGFFVMVAVINTINATASNLHMRRREFAQLRVIGVSKPHLVKMVMLEGVITSVIGGVAGVLVGGVLSCIILPTLHVLFGAHYYFPVPAAVIAVVAAVLVTCASIYFPIQRLGNDLADDLKTSGD